MSIIRLPGLIDVHVHLRDPGQTHKEDFYTGTSAALAGGFTTVLDMPNNKTPITTYEALRNKIAIAKNKVVCDVGSYFGSLGDNIKEFSKVRGLVFGLKLYLNMTTGNYLIDKKKIPLVFEKWFPEKPILLHSEGGLIEEMIEYATFYKRKIHICHISRKKELEIIMKAKKNKIKITCGVTPHHLFLTKKDGAKLGSLALMKPPLSTQQDTNFLWKNIHSIDVIESDHAPHTLNEKKSLHPAFGIPGLETTLPLLLTAVSEKKITVRDIMNLCYLNPKKIFKVPTQPRTYVEVRLNQEYIINPSHFKTKSKWSPFKGWKVKDGIVNVVLRGKLTYNGSKILVKKGFGKVL